MVRWNWCSRVCVIAFLLSATGELLGEEAGGSQGSRDKSQEPEGRSKVSSRAPGRDAAMRGAIEGVFRAQQDAWNGGDVRAFMDHYWKSDDLTFSSGGKTTRGWQATLAGYLERYPTREKMGRLTLSGLEITPLGDAAALVLGQWKLDRQSEPVGGNFTLVLRKLDGRWVIVHDHTSRLAE
jgi:ketosteroid isomerase-like protein